MSPNQRLTLICDRNRLRPRYGLAGWSDIVAGYETPDFYKRKAAEELLCLRENRSALRMWGRPHSGAAAIKLGKVRWLLRLAAQLSRKDPIGRAQNALALVKSMIPHPVEIEMIAIDGEVVFPPAAE